MLTSEIKDFNLAVNTHIDRRRQTVIDVGSDRQLLFDDLFIAPGKGYQQYPYNIRWTTAPIQKQGDPIFEGELPWEKASAWVCVMKDSGMYRMWYNASHEGYQGLVVSYAEADDGIHFRRKEVGLVEFQGSKQNNIVFTGGMHGVSPELGNVFIDPHAPEDERYKMIYTDWEGPHVFALPFTHNVGMLRGAASADGLNWQRYYDNFYGRYCDSQNSACWDETLGKFIIYHRSFGTYGGVEAGTFRIGSTRRGRAVGRMESDDFRVWSASKIALQADFHDGLNTDVYNSAYSRYPGSPHCHFMFPSFYRHYEGTFNVQVCVSRDNQNWFRPTRETFIPLGEPGSFDSFIISVAPGFVPVDADHYALYYRSGDMPHGGSAPVMSDEEKQTKKSRVSRVLLKRDRVIGIEAGDAQGQFSTRLLRTSGTRLLLNVEPVRANANLSVQLLAAETDEPLAGYTFETCRPLAEDDLDAIVLWNGSDRIEPRVISRPVRLHVRLQNMRIYAFEFADSH